MRTIQNKRGEIRSRNSGAVINTVGSLKDAKFWFENMTYFQVPNVHDILIFPNILFVVHVQSLFFEVSFPSSYIYY